ncbi:MAG: hypothetical protein J6R10_02095, partial [Tidjanibacter sp.]|nr:hypothetical protein [Tidjanibacter sp.]
EGGFVPRRDDDGDIIVNVQGFTFFVFVHNDNYVRVWLPKLWSLDSEQEFAKAHFVANRLNKEYRVGKIYIDENDTYGLAEFFIDKNDAQLKTILLRMFDILLNMRMEFSIHMRSE